MQFFRDRKNAQFQKQLEMFGLGEGMEKFLDYLKSEKCNELFRCNKISIDFDIGNIFFDHVNGERVFLILLQLNKITIKNCYRET